MDHRRASRARSLFVDDPRGSAPLHPRLYAIAALRGLKEAFTNLIQTFLRSVDCTSNSISLTHFGNRLDFRRLSQLPAIKVRGSGNAPPKLNRKKNLPQCL